MPPAELGHPGHRRLPQRRRGPDPGPEPAQPAGQLGDPVALGHRHGLLEQGRQPGPLAGGDRRSPGPQVRRRMQLGVVPAHADQPGDAGGEGRHGGPAVEEGDDPAGLGVGDVEAADGLGQPVAQPGHAGVEGGDAVAADEPDPRLGEGDGLLPPVVVGRAAGVGDGPELGRDRAEQLPRGRGGGGDRGGRRRAGSSDWRDQGAASRTRTAPASSFSRAAARGVGRRPTPAASGRSSTPRSW